MDLEPHNRRLVAALLSGNLGEVRNALVAGGDPDCLIQPKRDLPQIDLPGDVTPLLFVPVAMGRFDLVVMLVEAGARIDSRTQHEKDYQTHDDSWWAQGGTALGFAARSGRIDIVRYLAERGGDLDSRDEDLRTPLSLASENGWGEIVSFLIGRGARTDLPDGSLHTAIHYASRGGYYKIVGVLLDSGAKPGPKDRTEIDWEAALVNHACRGDLEGVQEAVRRGVTIDLSRAGPGLRALKAARRAVRSEVEEFLIREGSPGGKGRGSRKP